MRPSVSSVAAALAGMLVAAPCRAAIVWGTAGCETPDVYYSTGHVSGRLPCCTRSPNVCPGGVACVGGRCAAPYDGVACVPAPGLDAPDVILFIVDDNAYCNFGFMGRGCRTHSTGRALPAPATPNLDRLALQPANAGRGRVFPFAQSAAPVCAPSRQTLLSGFQPKDLASQPAPTLLPRRLHAEDGPVYCSLGAGKVEASAPGFDAILPGRALGRNRCQAAPCAPGCDDPPRCGLDAGFRSPGSLVDLLAFIDATLLGPRAADALDPSVVYTRAQPFLLWYGPWMPHKPHDPPAMIEDRAHLPLPMDYLFGRSALHPGLPRFPFGDLRYRPLFLSETALRGLYGMIWWMDDGLRQLRRHLEGIRIREGGDTVSLWDRTVVLVMADNAFDLPHAKFTFSENGYRTPILLYDASLPASAAEPRVDEELGHGVDVVPTVLDYAGRSPAGLPGRSLRPYLPGPPPAPLRDTVCGHDSAGNTPAPGRYIVTRPGTVGRCVSGASCAVDADCAGGVCLAARCGEGRVCLEDDDCPPSETCALRSQRWCRYGHDPIGKSAVLSPDRQPNTPCETDADCAAQCPSAESLYCTCEHRVVKLYGLADGHRKLMDLWIDPDEAGLLPHEPFTAASPGDLAIGSGDPYEHLAKRLGCCLDHWWAPPRVNGIDSTCGTCETRWECRRCGDGVRDAVEECDGGDLGGATCASVGGFGGGALACDGACRFDTTGCTP